MLGAMPHLKSVCNRKSTIHLQRLYGSWHGDTNLAREREVPTLKNVGKMDGSAGWVMMKKLTPALLYLVKLLIFLSSVSVRKSFLSFVQESCAQRFFF
jgi:hypothetical protein